MEYLQRAQLAPSTASLKQELSNAFKTLKSECKSHWYPSVCFEMRSKRTALINNQSQNLDDNLNQGAIFRIFDGNTMFEEATDVLTKEGFEKAVGSLLKRVKVQTTSSGTSKGYSSPSWSERKTFDLDKEILSQIPDDADETTWVHFGIPVQESLWASNDEIMKDAKDVFEKLKITEKKLERSNLAADPQMLASRLMVEVNDFLFIDPSVRMSQSFARSAQIGMAMKNGQRGIHFDGGLGGRETTSVTNDDLVKVFENLEKVLSAEPLKPGRYKVLMHPAVTGVFAHEAFGHSQEGDTWARGRSMARDLYESQEKVGNEYATILNNPAIYRNGDQSFAAWGSYYFDEEGWLAQKNYLVKEGLLQPPMTNLTSSLRLNVPRTANGKRESWTHGIYTRQTNTYFAAGKETLNELMNKVDYGFLATQPYGGMEDPKGMGIQVGIQYLEEIVDGKLTGKVFKGPADGEVQMTGYVPDYLNSILGCSKITFDDSKVDESEHPWNKAGGCGKYHKEAVAAGCGGPYLLVDKVLLG